MTLAVLTQSGFHLTRGPRAQLSGGWLALDRPRAPLSRDVALAVNGGHAHVVWSDQDGLCHATLLRGDLRQPGLLEVGATNRVGPATGASVSYPVAAYVDEDGTLDLFWTPDRVELRRLTVRQGLGSGYAQTLPTVGPAGAKVRLRALDLAPESAKTAWLTCATDRGGIALARWDLGQDVHTSWHEVQLPVPHLSGAALVRIGEVPMLLIARPDGRILAADARTAHENKAVWRQVEVPAATQGRPVQAIAAADGGGRAWLAAAGAGRLWFAPLRLRDGRLMCGEVRDMAMA